MAQFIAITLSDLEASAAKFKSIEPRGLFYHAATTLVELAIEGNGKLKTAEALAVLLQTWNKAYYRTLAHVGRIQKTLDRQHDRGRRRNGCGCVCQL